jgi:hypothetical protein
MENLTYKDFNSGKGFVSYELREELSKLGLKDNDIVINFAYSDYGGDFFDRVAIEYLQKHYPENILVENTCYYGKNAILYGQIAKEFIDANIHYPLGFEGLEDFYYQKENEAQEIAYTDILKEYSREYFNKNDIELSENIQEYIRQYLRDNHSFSVLSSGYCDYCESDIFSNIDKFINNELQMILSVEREEKADSQTIGKLF